MFWSSNLYSFVPLFPKNRLMFPCSLRYFANVPFFPKTPAWEDPRYFCFRSKLNYVLLRLEDTSFPFCFIMEKNQWLKGLLGF